MRGLLLVEVAVALVVISILVLALFHGLSRMIIVGDAEMIKTAGRGIAEGEVAASMLTRYADLAVTPPNTPAKLRQVQVSFDDEGTTYSVAFGVERTVTEDTSRGLTKAFKRITIRVYWPDDPNSTPTDEVVIMSLLSK